MEHRHSITDPVEKIIADGLTKAGIKYYRFYDGLDFTLEDGTQIECKCYYTKRVNKQLEQHLNVILIQGIDAAKTFINLINNGGIKS